MAWLACGWLVGLWWLQQQAELLHWPWRVLAIVFAIALCWVQQRLARGIFKPLLLVLAAAIVAAQYGAWRSEMRLADRLATQLERQDVWVQGVVTELPQPFERGVRFVLNVEQAEINTGQPFEAAHSTANQATQVTLPENIALSWYSDFRVSELQAIPEVLPGQRWRLLVRLKRPHGTMNPHGFDYEYLLLERGIGATGYVRASPHNQRLQVEAGYRLQRWRHLLRERIQQQVQDLPYGGVIVALVLGDQRAIPNTQWQLFNQTGISHLVSISGLHVTMIAGLFAWLASWAWRRSQRLPLKLPAQKVALLAGMLSAVAYCALAGWGVPAQRTFLMLSTVAVLLWLNRFSDVRDVLALAVLLVLLIDPWAILSAGFWLSFVAVAIILWVTYQPPLALRKDQAVNRPVSHPVSVWRMAVRVQLAITLGLVPFGILFFQSVSLVSPFANAVAIPFVSWIITPLALLGTLWNLLLPDIGLLAGAAHLFAWLAQGLSWAIEAPWALYIVPVPNLWISGLALLGTLLALVPMNGVVWLWLEKSPLQPTARAKDGHVLPRRGSESSLTISQLGFLRFVRLLFGALVKVLQGPSKHWRKFQAAQARYSRVVVISGIAVLVVLCWLPLLLYTPSRPSIGELRMTALDVGQGSAVLVQTAQHTLLYDTGPAYGLDSDSGQRIVIPYLRSLGLTHLDRMVVTHQDNDHAGGALSVLAALNVAQVDSSLPTQEPQHRIVQAAPRHQACQQGMQWQWDGVRFNYLFPDAETLKNQHKPNARSCVLQIITASGHKVLLTGDIEAAQEQQLIAQYGTQLKSAILLAPHHGSGTSSTLEFLQTVQPQHALFQVGYLNRFNHPKTEIWQRYAQLGVQRWRTDQHGAVTIETQKNSAVLPTPYRLQQPRYWRSE